MYAYRLTQTLTTTSVFDAGWLSSLAGLSRSRDPCDTYTVSSSLENEIQQISQTVVTTGWPRHHNSHTVTSQNSVKSLQHSDVDFASASHLIFCLRLLNRCQELWNLLKDLKKIKICPATNRGYVLSRYSTSKTVSPKPKNTYFIASNVVLFSLSWLFCRVLEITAVEMSAFFEYKIWKQMAFPSWSSKPPKNVFEKLSIRVSLSINHRVVPQDNPETLSWEALGITSYLTAQIESASTHGWRACTCYKAGCKFTLISCHVSLLI